MNYNELIRRLSRVSPDSFEYEGRVLVESFTDYNISYVLAHKSEDISNVQLDEALDKREKRIPLQYILGEWEFYRQRYIVNENCLIPRSDTEILVERAIEFLPLGAYFLDLCTGSGCIAISVLCERNDTKAVLVDKFEKTLDIAKKNAELNCVNERAQTMLFDVLTEESALGERKFDAILSNPPYIRPEVIETLAQEVKCEPYEALYGGDDGLIFYRKIIGAYSRFVKKGGFMLFEIGYDQGDSLRSISRESGLACDIIKDYGGNDRIAYLTGF